MRLKSILRTLFYIAVGGVAFWSPDIIIHALRSYEFSGRDVAVISLLSLGTLLACYGLIYWSRGEPRNAPSIAVPMLIGVWLFGSTAMMIGASYTGGGFAVSGIDTWFLISSLPPYNLIMATYDGSLGAFLLAHVIMLLMCFLDEREQWHKA